MESGIWLIIVTALSGKVAYHCFRYKNAYWAVPTISGFKTRKEPIKPLAAATKIPEIKVK